jgi:type I restriction enzyme S subunit
VTSEFLLQEVQRVTDHQGAVRPVRQFALSLAVSGGLAPQEDNDEPAVDLVDRLMRDARSTASPSRRPSGSRLQIQPFPFKVPKSWVWASLVDVCQVSYGFAFDSAHFGQPGHGRPLIRIRDIASLDTQAYYDGPFDPRYLVAPGDYLVGMDGDFNLRQWRGPEALLNQRVLRLQSWRQDISPRWTAIPLQMILDHLHISTSQTTVKHLSAKQVNGIRIPLPPLEEQHRIVAKVDELMALCDELEVAQTHREARRDRLRTTSLRDLVAPDESKQNARFFLRHSARMITKPEHVAGARQAILDLAVRGRLVAQDPRDETAAGPAISLNGHGANTSDDSIDSILPSAWIWSNLASVVYMESGDRSKNYPSKEHRVTSGVPFVNAGNLCDDRISESDLDYISEERLSLLRAGKFARDDILFCLRGSLGKVARVSNLDRGAIASSLIILRAGPAVHVTYLHLFLKSGLVAEQIREFDNGTAQPNLAGKDLGRFRVPLPPLAEQHRIVAKVDELMAVCDGLKQSLAAEQTERGRLLEALLHDALEDALPARELEPLGAR